ncbi:hypothetical protein ACFQ49_10140 [Kroppenstedtia eburnea]|uniref:Uncharacterized protein n=1 Tax=Kroppenstedtia eburnea TaxID=714067 RepID=A0A1N7MII6_9BACL|nr:hypothetical protein [Kroppenstedtia eburnea]EGK07126.1 hypothetical protein HMPREF9374_3887 [Desmospora sp. 8437]QKI81597.1 hypothetical protein GXN75_06060 [Kroppenstedtia eburnea]SIS85994.1 hypothetical protein SAMN05421790_106123 [Kroppenstedtia eburnea]
MIISRKRMAKAKVEKLKRGFSAYAETKEVADLIEKELAQLDLPVIVEQTQIGYWFIPDVPAEQPLDNPPGPIDTHCS